MCDGFDERHKKIACVEELSFITASTVSSDVWIQVTSDDGSEVTDWGREIDPRDLLIGAKHYLGSIRWAPAPAALDPPPHVSFFLCIYWIYLGGNTWPIRVTKPKLDTSRRRAAHNVLATHQSTARVWNQSNRRWFIHTGCWSSERQHKVSQMWYGLSLYLFGTLKTRGGCYCCYYTCSSCSTIVEGKD